jgi:hypothetical protein
MQVSIDLKTLEKAECMKEICLNFSHMWSGMYMYLLLARQLQYTDLLSPMYSPCQSSLFSPFSRTIA